jgi:hypothetical protein
MIVPQEGKRLKHRPTGDIFKVKKITDRFVILDSVDGLIQILAEKKSFAFPFEFREVARAEPTQERSAGIMSPKGVSGKGRPKKWIRRSRDQK